MTGEQDNIIALNSETIKNPDNVKMLIDFLVSQAQVLTLSPDQAYYLPKDDTKHNINGKQFYIGRRSALINFKQFLLQVCEDPLPGTSEAN